MNQSTKTMLLGMGIIQAGIIGALFNMVQSHDMLLNILGFWIPVFAMLAGPLIMLIGFFKKD